MESDLSKSPTLSDGAACEMMFTGDVIDADTALRYGLVLDVAPAGGALDGAKALADRIAQTSRSSVAAIKRDANTAWNCARADVDAVEEAAFPGLFGPEQPARMHAFLEDQTAEEARHG